MVMSLYLLFKHVTGCSSNCSVLIKNLASFFGQSTIRCLNARPPNGIITYSEDNYTTKRQTTTTKPIRKEKTRDELIRCILLHLSFSFALFSG